MTVTRPKSFAKRKMYYVFLKLQEQLGISEQEWGRREGAGGYDLHGICKTLRLIHLRTEVVPERSSNAALRKGLLKRDLESLEPKHRNIRLPFVGFLRVLVGEFTNRTSWTALAFSVPTSVTFYTPFADMVLLQ